MCLISLQQCARKQKKATFKKALINNGIKYKPEYAFFLMRLARLLNKYPRLLRSSKPQYWFKSNMKYIEKICSVCGSELRDTNEENNGMEYDEEF